MAQPLDFKEVAAAALQMHAQLLPEWIGGKRVGREWQGETRANGGLGNSWTINIDTGNWLHGAGDERGLDLISLYAALHHIDQLPALKEVAERVGAVDTTARVLPRAAVPEMPAPAEWIPPDAPMIPMHHKHGAPIATYKYGNAFVIARYETAQGEKTFSPFTWRDNRWQAKAWPDPKPLYGAETLPKHPGAAVLIVEGEKCADIARRTLKAYVTLTWAGGANAVKKSDWSALKGRDVIIWPDADDAGRNAAAWIAAHIAGSAKLVRVIQPNGQPEGWDIADAVAQGWDAKKIASWAGEHLRVIPQPDATPIPSTPASAPAAIVATPAYLPAKDRLHAEDYPHGQPPRSAMLLWKDLALDTDSKDIPYATLANTSLILLAHEKFKGKIWWDSFCERIYHTLYGPVPQEWNDVDSARVTAFIQQQLQLPKITLKLVQESIIHAAHEHARNSVQDWLNALSWDGVKRLDTWLGDCLGVDLTPYTIAVGRNWLISMVARAFVPGNQVDTMPVLEGTQGEGKSSALEIIGGQWFSAVGTAFGSHEFIQTIQGKWLIEIPDMAGFSRRDHSNVISTITTRTDRYRMKYGRFDQDHPRKCVFAATSETDDYLPEMRGYRRYWPLRCKAIDLDALRAQREQLFAEAVIARRGGEKYHLMPVDDTSNEQRARGVEDPWTEDVLAYCEPRGLAGHPVHPPKILTDSAIQLKHSELDLPSKLRVTNILKSHGWIPKTVDNIRQYVRPRRKE